MSPFASLPARHQRGFTLVEILLVLGIIAVLAIAAFVIYPKVQTSAQARLANSQITTIRAGVQSLFAMNRQYPNAGPGYGDFTKLIIQAKLVPDNMIDASGDTLHDFSQLPNTAGVTTSIVDAADGFSHADNHLFDIYYRNIPQAACVKLANLAGPAFDNLYINGQQAFTTTAPFTVDPAQVATLCNAQANTTLEFISR